MTSVAIITITITANTFQCVNSRRMVWFRRKQLHLDQNSPSEQKAKPLSVLTVICNSLLSIAVHWLLVSDSALIQIYGRIGFQVNGGQQTSKHVISMMRIIIDIMNHRRDMRCGRRAPLVRPLEDWFHLRIDGLLHRKAGIVFASQRHIRLSNTTLFDSLF